MRINYYIQDCSYKFEGKRKTRLRIERCIAAEGKKTGKISIIFCSDDYLLEINKTHLDHDYFTDIITFDYGTEDIVSGDLFISVDTVRENAPKFGATPAQEMLRVIMHGILHLCGYGDKTDSEAAEMRRKEDFYIGNF